MSGDIQVETGGSQEEEVLSFVEILGIQVEPRLAGGMLVVWETHHMPENCGLNCFLSWAMMRSLREENILGAEMCFLEDILAEDAGALVDSLTWPFPAGLRHPFQRSRQTCHPDLLCRN